MYFYAYSLLTLDRSPATNKQQEKTRARRMRSGYQFSVRSLAIGGFAICFELSSRVNPPL